VAALRYSLCVVARVAAAELAGEGAAALSLPRRRELFNLAAAWAEEGAAGGARVVFRPARPASARTRGLTGGGARQGARAARWRARRRPRACAPRTPRPRAPQRPSLRRRPSTWRPPRWPPRRRCCWRAPRRARPEQNSRRRGRQSARRAQGPSLDPDAKRASGRAYAWIDGLLQSDAPAGGWRGARGASRDAVARRALRNLLSTNADALAVCLDQCYAGSAPVARAYFQARPPPGAAARPPAGVRAP